MKLEKLILITIFLYYLIITPTFSYIGPGMGVGAIIGVASILIVLVLTIIALIYYPLKIWIKKIVKKKNENNKSEN